MRLTTSWSLTFPFLGLAVALCNVAGENPSHIANLADLRTPTPFTFTLTAIASGCDTVFSISETFFVNGTLFPGDSPVTVTLNNSQSSYVFASVTFGGLTVTSLTPGELMTLFDNTGDTGITSNPYLLNSNTRYTVPPTAIPYSSSLVTTNTSTSRASSMPTSTSTSSSVTKVASINSPAGPASSSIAQSNSLPVGGIVAGVVVGAIIIVAILVFGWYKVQQLRTTSRINRQEAGYGPEPGVQSENSQNMRSINDLQENPMTQEN